MQVVSVDFFTLELFYSLLVVILTVFVVVLVKRYGNIPGTSIGTDLNILTYGFLCDIAIKAIRGIEYWEKYSPAHVYELPKPTVLLLIFLINTLLMAWNFKITYRATTENGAVSNWLLKPLSISFGLVSLIFFLVCRVAWG